MANPGFRIAALAASMAAAPAAHAVILDTPSRSLSPLGPESPEGDDEGEASEDAGPDPEILATPHLGRRVRTVEFKGNQRTRTSFLRRLLTFGGESILGAGDVARSVQNLKNTKLFKKIQVNFLDRPDGGLLVRFELEELWTTIPVVLFSTGGGSVLVLAGIVEANLFGYGAVSYLTYQYLDGTSTWTGQLKHPDIFDSGFEFTPYFWLEEKNNEIREYDAGKGLLGGYTSRQETFGANLRRQYSLGSGPVPIFSPGAGLRYSKWGFNEGQLSDEAKEGNARNGIPLPEQTRRVYPSAEFQVGRVDFDGDLAEGATFLYRYTRGLPLTRESGEFQEHFVAARVFHSFPPDTLIAGRLEWQVRASDTAGDEDMMGGLFHVRGLPNDVFRGLTLWFANLEMRRVVRRQRYVHWQAVAFTDAGDTGRTRTQVRPDYRPSGHAHSVGAGLHLTFPDVSELALRVDYGWLVSPFRASGLSLGLVQFIR